MLALILGCVLAIILAVIAAELFYDDDAAAVVAILGLAAAIFMPMAWGPTEDYTRTNKLKAISVGQEQDGSFFLGSGRLDDEPVFFYYQKNSDGSYTLNSVDAERTKIIEDDSTPRLERECTDLKRNLWNVWQFTTCDYEYKFHVPKGSVTNSMNLELPQ